MEGLDVRVGTHVGLEPDALPLRHQRVPRRGRRERRGGVLGERGVRWEPGPEGVAERDGAGDERLEPLGVEVDVGEGGEGGGHGEAVRRVVDDPVASHLPWFDLRQAYKDSPPITVQGLLTHSSGLPRESDHPYWTGPEFEFPTREQVIERLSSQETLYPAYKYFQYSNLGLTLAGEIVAEVSGRPYADYVRQNILGPLGLESTSPEIPAEHRGGRLAIGYGALPLGIVAGQLIAAPAAGEEA